MAERIVVTGLGAISPLGLSAAESWQNAVAGVSGVGPLTLIDASAFQVRIACEVKGFQAEDWMPAREARRRDRFEHFASAAASQAIQQAGLSVSEAQAGRVGVIVSSAIGGLTSLQENILDMQAEGPRRISPFLIPRMMSNGAAGLIAIDHGYRGPCFAVASACASGADGIGIAWQLLRSGAIDAALAGAAEATITEVGVGAFDRLGALSRHNDDYDTTPRPFDLNRDGFVMGEGAAILVLETESHARRRGALILAELAGYGATADAYHITAPSEDGVGGAQAIAQALANGQIEPDEVGYINAHGTATELNDISETKAIKAVFGERAYKIPVSSTKSMTGHMMGATGALEALFCVQAVRENLIPPTIHYQTPDPQCDLDYVPNRAREQRVKVAISNAFGFGGHNAVLAFREYN